MEQKRENGTKGGKRKKRMKIEKKNENARKEGKQILEKKTISL